MSETLTQPVRDGDIEAAKQLAAEALSTVDIATLREMVADQNGGETTIVAEDGTEVSVASIGTERFAELGKQAEVQAQANSAEHAETWHTEEK